MKFFRLAILALCLLQASVVTLSQTRQTRPLQPAPQQLPPGALNPAVQLDPCVQLVQAGGVRIDLAAVASGPDTVTLNWSGFPGVYEISTTGPGAPFRGSATLPALQALSPGGRALRLPAGPSPQAPQLFPGTLTHTPTLPATQYRYTLTGTLSDGRKACGGAIVMTAAAPARELRPIPVNIPLGPPAPVLSGWVDLHTHPMSHLAFGGKLFHGAPDICSAPSPRRDSCLVPELKSLVPAADHRPIPFPGQCRKDVQAMTMEDALNVDAPTHGDPRMSPGCGDQIRHTLIGAMELFKGLAPPGNRHGAPFFDQWPRWNDLTHQKMWFEWIERARLGGLRVMVALSHNSRTLGDAVGPGGPISGVTDDMRSSDLQIEAIKQFVAAHPDIMELALNAAHVHDIVQRNHIAVVLGVEIDNIGNFKGSATETQIAGEIQRLWNQGVRYIFPVHLTDNLFGGTAIYDAQFNWANFRENGRFWDVECANRSDEIGMQLKGGANYDGVLVAHLRFIKLGINPTTYPPQTPACPFGHKNRFGKGTPTSFEGLTNAGRFALREMMKRGMIIDIDHMNQYAVEDALRIAEAVPAGGYPLVSGHSGIRNPSDPHANSERMITRTQLARLACLHGMLGLGTAGVDAWNWAQQYTEAFNEMSKPTSLCANKSWLPLGRVALGTDANSLVATPAPPSNRRPIQYTASFQPSRSGTRTWDYNVDGVAHYGMFADFVQDVRTATTNPGMSGPDLVDNHLMRSADYFWRMWQRIETQRSNVR